MDFITGNFTSVQVDNFKRSDVYKFLCIKYGRTLDIDIGVSFGHNPPDCCSDIKLAFTQHVLNGQEVNRIVAPRQ